MKKTFTKLTFCLASIALCTQAEAQNVGIGTMTPTEKLHVVGNARITALGGTGNALVQTDNNGVLSTNAYTGNNTDVLTGDGNWTPINSITDGWRVLGNTGTTPATNFLGTIDAQDLVIRTNNTEKLRVLSGGNIGIGTPTAPVKLSLRRAAGNNIVGITQQQVGGAATMEFTTDDGTGAQATRLLLRGNGPSTDIEIYNGNRGAENLYTIFDASTESVGIGVNPPASKLHVRGASADESSAGIFRIDNAAGPNLRMGVVSGSRSWIQSHASLPLYINRLGNNTIINETDGANRNVGIGVVAPVAKLEVDFNTNNDFSTVKANGQFGPTRGYLGVQGKTNFDGIATADWDGEEIGVAGISTGSSSTDNFGVKGHSNHVGVRGEHSGGANWAELGTAARSINANGDAYVNNGWLSVGGNTGNITRYGVYETTWQGNISFDQNGYRYYDIGNFNYPNNGLPGTVTITKIIWEMDGYHEDANEDHGVWIKLGGGNGGPWYGWFGNAGNGAKDVNWHYVSGALAVNFNRGTVIRMRVEDDCCFGDDMLVFNLHIKIYYRYTQALQNGDISASGRVYANSNTDVGDMAEYFEVDQQESIEVGSIVVLNPKGDNNYMLSREPYQQHIVGVISENPSVVLNNPNVGPPVALAGRVKVRLKQADELIKTGDFLTTSDVNGCAMLATEMGPIIGYAVKNQKAGEDFVEILVQPGRFYYPKKRKSDSESKDDGHSRRRY